MLLRCKSSSKAAKQLDYQLDTKMEATDSKNKNIYKVAWNTIYHSLMKDVREKIDEARTNAAMREDRDVREFSMKVIELAEEKTHQHKG